ncbi:hypothetical protein LR021_01210 [Candidatus Bipolaricaulota bacterium]|nr:hypothetical protein [Candidatus Bipolaricaulota bacterium]HBR10589.1 hypothetical protein [Candidatus Acetothermia bacterium]
MMKDKHWLIAALTVFTLGVVYVTLIAAQMNPQPEITLEDLYALLVTEDGQSRLARIEEALAAQQEKIDTIQITITRIESALLKRDWDWTLRDIEDHLRNISEKLDALLRSS